VSAVAPPRVCPLCGDEYLATVERCPECGVALVEAGTQAERGAAPGLPPSADLVRLRVENPVWIAALAERLAAEGVPSRVELVDPAATPRNRLGSPCALFVRAEDVARARAVDAELLRDQLPDLPEGASSGWSEAEGCPACGAAVGPDAAECPECGLAFVEAE
jgi:hypothetical protein